MKLLAAKAKPGARVIYTHPSTGKKESGVILGIVTVGIKLVNVRYGNRTEPTHPTNLEFDRSKT
ncbi:hypothetical protein [Rhodococcus erythropolis]|uniref:Uncharacterized protein n=1 Tax=Rhodococcus erythropolis (strain PR4 / NBRC 100887) TaxID=234621 RepID=C0ZXB3_RHOE4|nr:hypothetical protein [Rhodococcus erythropolis]BAH32998.1 hypothetical protein RER_22900 [Rhodococcus erythropolis PR4]